MLNAYWHAVAGSPHAHVHARWIYTCPCPCPLDLCMHALTGYAHMHVLGPCMHTCTGSMHACSHWTPCLLTCSAHARTLAPGPHAAHTGSHAHSLAGSPTLLGLHARTHWVRVPMPARSWGPSHMHTPGPHARSLTGSPYTHTPGHTCTLAPGPHTHSHSVSMHARMHWAHVCMLARRVPACMHQAYARTLAPGPPCPLACRVPMHVCRIPALMHAASHVVCSSNM